VSYLIKRLIQIPLVVILVVTFGFILLKISPGDPVSMFAGEGSTPEYLEMIRKAYGLDQPVSKQYTLYMLGILKGNWGHSLSYDRPVTRWIFVSSSHWELLSSRTGVGGLGAA